MYQDFLKRCVALRTSIENLPSDFQVDHLVFHEGNITELQQKYLTYKSKLALEFIDVSEDFKWETPGASKYCSQTQLSESFSTGYKSMCRFWLGGFIRYTSTYDFVVRLDEDCVLVDFDLHRILSDMVRNKIAYVTPLLYGADDPEVTMGLNEFVIDFASKYGVVSEYDPNINPYTNLFILDYKKIAESSLFVNFVQEVAVCGCIYINRWGDLPLWGVVLQLVVGDENFKVRSDIKYIHSSIGDFVNKRGLRDSLYEFFFKMRQKLFRTVRRIIRVR